MLMVAAGQMLTSEFKSLWLLQCQPRPLADVMRSKARVWAVISMCLSVPFVVTAIALRPAEAVTILFHAPFLLVSLWLLAEVIFGLTALAATVTNEQTVRFRRSNLLPLLVIGNLSVAIYSQNWWMELSALVTLAVFNATVARATDRRAAMAQRTGRDAAEEGVCDARSIGDHCLPSRDWSLQGRASPSA